MDPDVLTALLQAAARGRNSVTYSEALAALGHGFSRPRMRALCKLLEHVDSGERGAGRPELAVLVVRQSDGLPGQGWWVAEAARGTGYRGAWLGPAAAAWVARRQAAVFDWWSWAPPHRVAGHGEGEDITPSLRTPRRPRSPRR